MISKEEHDLKMAEKSVQIAELQQHNNKLQNELEELKAKYGVKNTDTNFVKKESPMKSPKTFTNSIKKPGAD